MKYTEKMFFAQPVLRQGFDDFPQGSFSVDLSEVTISDDQVEFAAEVALKCPSLSALVQDGSASVGLFLTCMDTRINRFFPLLLGLKKEIRMASGKLFGRVTLLPVIFTTKDISGWRSEDLHDEYGGHSNLPNASLLAVGDEGSFTVDRKRLKPLESIFELASDDTAEEGTFKVDTDNERICILVNPLTKAHIDGVRYNQRGKSILLNTVYLPALMEVFSQIQQNGTLPEQYAWFRVFKAKCDALNIDPMTCQVLEAAQILLATPFLKLQPITEDIL